MMTRKFAHLILTASFSALLGSLTLSAQDRSETAYIPFAFNVEGRVLPAGDYKFIDMNSNGLFQMYDSEGRSSFVTMHILDQGANGHPRLIFRCYGSDRVLGEIWNDSGMGFGFNKSSDEKALHRRLEMATLISVNLTPR